MAKKKWYAIVDDRQAGPFAPGEFRELASQGTITPDSKVRRDDMQKFVRASRVKGLFPEPVEGQRSAVRSQETVPNTDHSSYLQECLTSAFKSEQHDDRSFTTIPLAQQLLDAVDRDASEALDLAEQLRSELPDFFFSYAWLSNIHRDAGRSDAAKSALADGIRQSRTKAFLVHKMAELEFEAGAFLEAIRWWSKSVVAQTRLDVYADHNAFLYLGHVADVLALTESSQYLIEQSDRIESGRLRLSPQAIGRLNDCIQRLELRVRDDVCEVLRRLSDPSCLEDATVRSPGDVNGISTADLASGIASEEPESVRPNSAPTARMKPAHAPDESETPASLSSEGTQTAVSDVRTVKCPHCEKRLTAKEQYLNKRAKCPGCGGVATIVATSEDVAAQPVQHDVSHEPATEPDPKEKNSEQEECARSLFEDYFLEHEIVTARQFLIIECCVTVVLTVGGSILAGIIMTGSTSYKVIAALLVFIGSWVANAGVLAIVWCFATFTMAKQRKREIDFESRDELTAPAIHMKPAHTPDELETSTSLSSEGTQIAVFVVRTRSQSSPFLFEMATRLAVDKLFWLEAHCPDSARPALRGSVVGSTAVNELWMGVLYEQNRSSGALIEWLRDDFLPTYNFCDAPYDRRLMIEDQPVDDFQQQLTKVWSEKSFSSSSSASATGISTNAGDV